MEKEKKPKSLNQKLLELGKSLPYFQKTAQGFNYQYVPGVDILTSIRAKMEELQLLLYPEITEANHILIEEMKHKKIDDKVVENEAHSSIILGSGFYVWEDAESGEIKKVAWQFIGESSDAAMAFGSALTYSERYFILKFFNIPTDALDPDKFMKAKAYLFDDSETPAEYKITISSDDMEWFKSAIKFLPEAKADALSEWIKNQHTRVAIAQTKKEINVIVDELNNR